MLHDNFTLHALVGDAIGAEIADLTDSAVDPNASDAEISRAGQTLGTITGSLNQAIDNRIGDAREDSQGLRVLTDFLSNRLISEAGKKAGPAGAVVSAAGKAAVNEFWENVADSAARAEGGRIDDTVGDLRTLLADIRDVAGEQGDPSFVSEFDDREDQYHDS